MFLPKDQQWPLSSSFQADANTPTFTACSICLLLSASKVQINIFYTSLQLFNVRLLVFLRM